MQCLMLATTQRSQSLFDSLEVHTFLLSTLLTPSRFQLKYFPALMFRNEGKDFFVLMDRYISLALQVAEYALRLTLHLAEA